MQYQNPYVGDLANGYQLRPKKKPITEALASLKLMPGTQEPPAQPPDVQPDNMTTPEEFTRNAMPSPRQKLEEEVAAGDKPPTWKQTLLQMVGNFAPVAAAGIFGGADAASGAAEGMLGYRQKEAATKEARRRTLMEEIGKERGYEQANAMEGRKNKFQRDLEEYQQGEANRRERETQTGLNTRNTEDITARVTAADVLANRPPKPPAPKFSFQRGTPGQPYGSFDENAGTFNELGKEPILPPPPIQVNPETVRHNQATEAEAAARLAFDKTKPAATGRRNVISGDANRIADYTSSLSDLKKLREEIPSGQTGAMAQAGAMVPNIVTQVTGFGMQAKQKQATIDRVKQVIGKALEGGVLRKEDEYKYEKILPTIGDPDGVVKAKLDGLDAAISQRLQTQLDSLEDAGFDVSRYRGRLEGGAPPPDENTKVVDGVTYKKIKGGWLRSK